MGKIENKIEIENLPGYWHSFSDYSPELGYGKTLVYETEKGHKHVAFTNTETNKTTVFNLNLYNRYLNLHNNTLSDQKPETD